MLVEVSALMRPHLKYRIWAQSFQHRRYVGPLWESGQGAGAEGGENFLSDREAGENI